MLNTKRTKSQAKTGQTARPLWRKPKKEKEKEEKEEVARSNAKGYN